MSILIAIGGGSFQKKETLRMEEYAIKKVNKPHPKVLFLPTASKDDQGYAKRFKQYMRALASDVEVIRLFHTKLSKKEVQERILACDILYLGAGNLTRLMEAIHTWDLMDTIKQAYEQGIVCMGNSAGASAFFTYGYSDIKDDGTCYDYVKGMDIITGCFCPHAQDNKRKAFFEIQNIYDIRYIGCHDEDAYIIEDNQEYYFNKNERTVV